MRLRTVPSRKTIGKAMVMLGLALVLSAVILSIGGYVSGVWFWAQVVSGALVLIVGIVVLVTELLTAMWSRAQTSLVDGLQAG